MTFPAHYRHQNLPSSKDRRDTFAELFHDIGMILRNVVLFPDVGVEVEQQWLILQQSGMPSLNSPVRLGTQ